MKRCRVCHRPLTTAESQAAGIGPTCRGRHFVSRQMSLFDVPREGGGGSSESEIRTFWDTVSVVNEGGQADDLAIREGGPLEEAPVVVVRWPLRAPWWLRVWRWIRGVIRA